jgi:tetratricopeptide (TPR) repeat protein
MGLFDWVRKRKASATQEHDEPNASLNKFFKKCSGPYEHGVNYLKHGEYPQAVTSFSKAIQVDPEAPNAYVGRGLAYRSLGDEDAATRDEEEARKLGGPERSAWDRLVNRGNRRWRGDLRDPAWRLSDALSRSAFLLRQWCGQVFNGGLAQWLANGYGEWAEDLAHAAREVNTKSAREVAEIVREIGRILTTRPGAGQVMVRFVSTQAKASAQETKTFEMLSWCERRYRRVQRRFEKDVEAWLEKQKEKPS